MKIKSSIFAFLGILSLLVWPVFQGSSQHLDYYEIVSRSFEATTGQKVALNIEGWAKISITDLTEQEIANKFQEITAALELEYDPSIERYPGFTKYYQENSNDETLISISLQSIFNDGLENGTYLGILITTTEFDNHQAKEYYQKLEEIFSPYQWEKDLGVTLTGTIPGQLNRGQMFTIVKEAFSAVNAIIIEGINTDTLISYSGYTKECKDFLIIGGQKINIHIGIRYHNIDNLTYINIGAPVIFGEY